MKIPFSSHIGTKVMALVLGVVLWGFAYSENLQDADFNYTVRLQQQSEWSLRPSERDITVKVRGPRRVIEALSLDRRITSIIDKSLDASLFATTEDSITIPVQITADDLPMRDSRLVFANLPITLSDVTASREVRKVLPVKLRVRNQPGSGLAYSEDGSRVLPSSVEVRGPKSVLDRAEAIYTTEIDLSNTGLTQGAFPVALDPSVAGQRVQLIDATQVTAWVAISRQLRTRTIENVPVRALIESGYDYRITLDPPAVSVTVEGSEQDIVTLAPSDLTVFVPVGSNYVPRATPPYVAEARGMVLRSQDTLTGAPGITIRSIAPDINLTVSPE